MRSPVLFLVLCAAVTAHANPKAKKAIREHLVAVANEQGDHASPTATALWPDGTLGKPDEVFSAMHRAALVRLTHTVGAIALVLDTTLPDTTLSVGWFQAPIKVVAREPVGNGDVGEAKTSQLRAGGIVIGVTGWTIEAVVYTRPLADKTLAQRLGVPLPTRAPTLAGDAKLAAAVAAWFPAGIAAAARPTTAQLIASGTAPADLATGAKALKLAKRWDTMKLVPTQIDARIVLPARVGFVTASVLMPKKSGTEAIELRLGAVVVADGASWRWVSLQLLAPEL